MAEASSLPQLPNADVQALRSNLEILEQVHEQLVEMNNLKTFSEMYEKEVNSEQYREIWEASKKVIEINSEIAIDIDNLKKMCSDGNPEKLGLYEKISSTTQDIGHLKKVLGLFPEQREEPRRIIKAKHRLRSAKKDPNNPRPFVLKYEPSTSTSKNESPASSSAVGPSLRHSVAQHLLAKPQPDLPAVTSNNTSADPSKEELCPANDRDAMSVRPDPGPENDENDIPLDLSMKNLSIGRLTDKK